MSSTLLSMTRYIATATVLLTALTFTAACDEEPPAPLDEADATSGDAGVVGEDVPTVLTDLGDQDCHLDSECLPEGEDVVLPQCQVIACVEFKCVFLDREDGLECDDGDLCSSGDVCASGLCVGESLSCDDGNPCTSDNCDPDGGCVNTFNQKPCDDGDDCTIQDHCSQGQCQGQALQCDDGNPCTDDACSPEGGCAWTHNTSLCSDANACTVGDACVAGKCVPGGALDCGTSTDCLLNTCDPVAGCQQTVVDGPCEDGDACTENDICMDTVCVGEPVSCDDSNPCTDDLCQAGTGVCEHLGNTGPCDDGDTCTLVDGCDGGICVGGSLDPLCCEEEGAAPCDDGDPCTEDGCVEAYCAFTPLDCSDGSVCTYDTCADGNCQHTGIGAVTASAPLTEEFSSPDGLGDWVVQSNNPLVTWQVDTLKVYDTGHSVYCGNVPAYSYDLGATDATLTRMISVPAVNPTLSYWITQDVADTTCNYDFTTTSINGGVLPVEHCGAIPNWTQVVVNLSEWAGQTVELQYRFQTIDALSNKGQGVWIDQVSVTGDDGDVCCLSVDDCGDDVGCLAALCDETSRVCSTPPASEACDDSDPCTSDACEADGSCVSTPIEACCVTDADCAEGTTLACETGFCDAGACAVDDTACCAEDSDCPVSDCSLSSCDGATGECVSTPVAGCCVTAEDCDDGDPCTQDACDDADGTSACSNEPIAGCCEDVSDCDAASKACEDVSCVDEQCALTAEACCSEDTDCDDLDACTADACDGVSGLCTNDAIADCCLSADDCPGPSNACVSATCDEGTNTCGEAPIADCCLSADDCPGPGDEDPACATPVCEANTCGLDTSCDP